MLDGPTKTVYRSDALPQRGECVGVGGRMSAREQLSLAGDTAGYEVRSVELLGEILKWVKVACVPIVRSVLEAEFPKSDRGDDYKNAEVAKSAVIYSYADGKRTQRDIAKVVGLSQPQISRRFARWERLGIMRAGVACFELSDFGLRSSGPSREVPAVAPESASDGVTDGEAH